MKYSNIHNIPEWLVEKIAREPRPKKPERMSTTDLIHPPRQRTLYLERYDDIVIDVSTLLAMWYGISLDSQFDDDPNAQNKMEFDIDGMTLVGMWDCLRDDIIQDYKFTKVGQKAYESTMKAWEQQLNVYDFLHNILDWHRVKGLENHLFYKDWSPVKVGTENGYPRCSWECVKQPQWTFEQQQQFVLDRLRYHREQPYDCPLEERWGSVVVKKKGQKRALIASVPGTGGRQQIKTHEQALKILTDKGHKDAYDKGQVYIEDRLGLRCKFWCSVSSVCPDSPNCIAKYRGKDLT